MTEQVSIATKRNWEKLGVVSFDDKLVSRANKKLSKKTIIPVEYFDNKNNIKLVELALRKLERLEANTQSIIYSLGVLLLQSKGLLSTSGKSDNSAIEMFVDSYSNEFVSEVADAPMPKDESDILGLIYQCLLQEGVKNIQGSYYTPKSVVLDMVRDIKLSPEQKVLDPCCGSLIYLLNIPRISPEQIYAYDNDPTAVMIAKFNYFLKFPNAPSPNIYVEDYLSLDKKNQNTKFDYIITNPPWGASTANAVKYSEIKSGETFSCFLVEAHKSLTTGGQLRFLLPESILNVRVHSDIREYILNKANLLSIKLYSRLFSGVTTKYVAIKVDRAGNKEDIDIEIADRTWGVKKSVYINNANHIFRLSDSTDESIIEKVLERKKYDLSDSVWALGIVTGNNKQKLFDKHKAGLEKIYTGKEITPYRLKDPRNYIKYDKSQLQQVAKDDIYRANPKLVYKFISKKLTFAVDESSSLFLNSANILIPNIPKMSIKTVAAFLNSELYQYLYIKLFREVKILKGNLIQLPFPEIDEATDTKISNLVNKAIKTGTMDSALQQIIFDYYCLDNTEIQSIRKELYGSAN